MAPMPALLLNGGKRYGLLRDLAECRFRGQSWCPWRAAFTAGIDIEWATIPRTRGALMVRLGRPVIVLDVDLDQSECEKVLAHELCHLIDGRSCDTTVPKDTVDVIEAAVQWAADRLLADRCGPGCPWCEHAAAVVFADPPAADEVRGVVDDLGLAPGVPLPADFEEAA